MGESSNDNAFWRPLRGITDLSLKFEETIFDLTLSSILIALSPVIIFHYLRQPVRIRRSVLLWTKIVSLQSYWCLHSKFADYYHS